LLLLRKELQHISGLGNVRQINLGPDLIGFAGRTGGPARNRLGRGLKMGPNFFRFEVLERTGMGFFLSDAHFRQHVENGFAFDFQLPG
jgi:hypothetical protein